MEPVALDVIKNSKKIEELKVELLKAKWQVQHGTLNASEKEILESMAKLVGLSYLLTRRLGFDFSRLDRVLYKQIAEWQQENYYELESEWGDLSLLLSYLVPEEDR